MSILKLLNIFLAFTVTFNCGAQLTEKTQKRLLGTWKYEGGSGFERWEKKGDQLLGKSYRTTKLGDTLLVENILVYAEQGKIYYQLNDLASHANYLLQATGKKLDFYNEIGKMPFQMKYKFVWYNKNKLKIYIRTSKATQMNVLRLDKIR